MKTIGILYGMENAFPNALMDRINEIGDGEVKAEAVKLGAAQDNIPARYDVIIDRISHFIPFFRAWVKHAALHGSIVINDPFRWSADDKFMDVTLVRRAGIAVPKSVIIPSKEHPPETTAMSMRNLIYPLDWEEVFAYIGFPFFMKPHSGGGWRNVYKIHSEDEFFFYYDQSGSTCMLLQEAIYWQSYYRCYCVGRREVRVMPYAPSQPLHLRYSVEYEHDTDELLRRVGQEALAASAALDYDFNSVEMAIRDGVPHAIDCLNPAPDCDPHSVTPAHFEWTVDALARYSVERASD